MLRLRALTIPLPTILAAAIACPALVGLVALVTLVTMTAANAGATGPDEASPGEPRRLTAEAFGVPVSLEVRDLPAETAQAVLGEAFHHLRETERTLAEAEERLNADPRGERAVALEPPVLALLARAQGFCVWSGGAIGPLGGSLADHWRAVGANPSPPPVPPELVATADCGRLALDAESGTARVAPGSRVSFDAFAIGFAVDRTIEKLRALGADNGRVRVGRIERAFGPGPHAAGWPTELPSFEGRPEPFDQLRLDDGSLAVLWRADWPADRPLFVNQRDGRPPEGIWATAVVTDLALDAQALSVAAMVLGTREGRFRMAGLSPEPAVLWLMGSGRGRPLRSDLNWSDLGSR